MSMPFNHERLSDWPDQFTALRCDCLNVDKQTESCQLLTVYLFSHTVQNSSDTQTAHLNKQTHTDTPTHTITGTPHNIAHADTIAIELYRCYCYCVRCILMGKTGEGFTSIKR